MKSIYLTRITKNIHPLRTPDLQDPSESKTGVHKLNDIKENLQSSDVTIKTIPEVNVLHLWGPGTTVNSALKDIPGKTVSKLKKQAFPI